MAFDPLFDLSGKSIIIAGAAGGIGSAITRCLSERAARLALFDIDSERLGRLQEDSAIDAVWQVADITDEQSCNRMVTAAQEAYGIVDIVINAAGVLPIAPAVDMDISAFRRCLDVNVTGALLLSRAAASLAIDSSKSALSIIHLGSVSSVVANPHYAAYASSKAALSHLVRVLAREWAASNIRVNAIGPALIETPLTDDYFADPAFRSQAIASIPVGRLATVEDLLPVVLMLCSDSSRFITGQTIHVDGGRTLV